MGAVFVSYVIETFGGIAPEAQTLNKKIATFAEEHSVAESREDFQNKLKSEIAAAIQFGNFRITKKGIQQSRVALKIPQQNQGIEDFFSTIMTGEEVPSNMRVDFINVDDDYGKVSAQKNRD